MLQFVLNVYPNLPNLLYIGHLTYLWNPYKINVFVLHKTLSVARIKQE